MVGLGSDMNCVCRWEDGQQALLGGVPPYLQAPSHGETAPLAGSSFTKPPGTRNLSGVVLASWLPGSCHLSLSSLYSRLVLSSARSNSGSMLFKRLPSRIHQTSLPTRAPNFIKGSLGAAHPIPLDFGEKASSGQDSDPAPPWRGWDGR